MKLVALIPHYRHIATLPTVIAALRAHNLPIMVIDDGSGETYQADLTEICREVQLFRLPENGGKGHAMKHGFRQAAAQGYTHALQIDADAQHAMHDIPKLIAAAQATPHAAICGRPIYGDDAPKARLYGRKITDFWNIIHTHSCQIKDGMCGFRIYPLENTLNILDSEYIGERMDFDNEILVHLYWRGVPLVWVDTPVRYQDGGISHFRAWQDNVLISKMHSRLFFRMLRRCVGLGK